MDEDYFLGKHPLASLEGAGLMQGVLRRQFHCLLQTVANKMPLVSGIHIHVHVYKYMYMCII